MVTKFVRRPEVNADVRRLLEIFGTLLPDGRLIAHESVEAAIGLTRERPRYRTVTNHWRNVVWQEQRVWLDGRSAEGHGFKALTPDEMVRFANREVRAIGKRVKRAILIAATPTDAQIQDPHTKLYRARLLSAAEQIAMAHGRVMKELTTALKPQRQLPKRTA